MITMIAILLTSIPPVVLVITGVIPIWVFALWIGCDLLMSFAIIKDMGY